MSRATGAAGVEGEEKERIYIRTRQKHVLVVFAHTVSGIGPPQNLKCSVSIKTP